MRPEFPDRLTIGPIDLTGPARFIHYGPYFALPAGAWSVDVSIETSDCFSEDLFEIDVTAGQVLSIVQAKLPQMGSHGCQVRFQLDDPLKPIEVRLKTLTGAIEGVMQLRSITLHRLASLDDSDDGEPWDEGAGWDSARWTVRRPARPGGQPLRLEASRRLR